jgi:hypothetical protein
MIKVRKGESGRIQNSPNENHVGATVQWERVKFEVLVKAESTVAGPFVAANKGRKQLCIRSTKAKYRVLKTN